ncbi:MAG: nitrite/sulfite reductase [bacterium]
MYRKFDLNNLVGLSGEEKIKLAGFDFDWKELAKLDDKELTGFHKTLFKWTGIYFQLQKGFHMMRVRAPGGMLSAKHCLVLAELADRYAQGDVCITTRQCIQLHWLKLEDLQHVLAALQQSGLSTKNAAGDVTRNICACPWSGVCKLEKSSARDALNKLESTFLKDEAIRNLPRKYKINISGCEVACAQPYMNDQGWVGTERDGKAGFKLYSGGGLGARPFLAKLVLDFVPQELVVQTSRACIRLFQDWGNRKNRSLARSKYVLYEFGVKKYQTMLMEYIAKEGVSEKQLKTIVVADEQPLSSVPFPFDRTQGVIEQKQPGKVLLQILVRRGDIKAFQLKALADLSLQYGDGNVYFTHRQNAELHSLSESDVEKVKEEVHRIGLATEGFMHLADAVSCVGTTYCNYAVSNTPLLYNEIIERLSGNPLYLKTFRRLLININGCPNSCGQHKIADIGLRGMRLPTPDGSVEAFEVSLGGDIFQGTPRLNEPVATVPASKTVDAVEKIVDAFVAHSASKTQTFRDFYEQQGRNFFVSLLNTPEFRPSGGVLYPSIKNSLSFLPDEVKVVEFAELL